MTADNPDQVYPREVIIFRSPSSKLSFASVFLSVIGFLSLGLPTAYFVRWLGVYGRQMPPSVDYTIPLPLFGVVVIPVAALLLGIISYRQALSLKAEVPTATKIAILIALFSLILYVIFIVLLGGVIIGVRL